MPRGAVNLWTVGCADPRLTAQARSPMDKPGKTPCVSPTLPTGRRLPTSFTAPRNKDRMNLIRGRVKPAAGYRGPLGVYGGMNENFVLVAGRSRWQADGV